MVSHHSEVVTLEILLKLFVDPDYGQALFLSFRVVPLRFIHHSISVCDHTLLLVLDLGNNHPKTIITCIRLDAEW